MDDIEITQDMKDQLSISITTMVQFILQMQRNLYDPDTELEAYVTLVSMQDVAFKAASQIHDKDNKFGEFIGE